MQASLAVVGGVLGLVAYLSTRLALVARSRRPARKLALHDLRDHADQRRYSSANATKSGAATG